MIARTSSFSFRGQTRDVAAIAERLKVAYVLEGSVRTAGNRMRIAARLVDTATERELWSQTYDRETGDALVVQAEIAAAVAEALEVTLTGHPTLTPSPPPAKEAVTHYLQGRYFYDRRGPGDVERAERHYLLALKADPTFTRALAGLAGVRFVQEDRGLVAPEIAVAGAREAAEQAVLHGPESAEAQIRAAVAERAVALPLRPSLGILLVT